MIYVLFEVVLKPGKQQDYLERAAALKRDLEKTPGVVRTERFQSLANERKVLSLNVWESEEAVTTWRNQLNHRESQEAGRDGIFEDYTITVLEPDRCYTMYERGEAPADSNAYFDL